MQICQMNWMQVEQYLKHDDRCVLPLGSVEQHAYLSLATDAILAERVAVDAAEPLGVPVFPVQSYGFTPYFRAFPGTVSLTLSTYLALIRDLIDGIYGQGFRRVVVVNGHGGNAPAGALMAELMADRPDLQVKFHNWRNAPRTMDYVKGVEAGSSHASWMENLPWTRLSGVVMPETAKPPVDSQQFALLDPVRGRKLIADGNFGGSYQRSDSEVLTLWGIAVKETQALIEGPWRADTKGD